MPQRSFMVFHIVLGIGLLVMSLQTLWRVVGPGAGRLDLLVMLIAAVEAVGAFLFLMPGSVRLGAGLLLLVLAVAFVGHVRRGQWHPELIIFASGVWLVAAKGDPGANAKGTGSA